jgi:hypothetical protein
MNYYLMSMTMLSFYHMCMIYGTMILWFLTLLASKIYWSCLEFVWNPTILRFSGCWVYKCVWAPSSIWVSFCDEIQNQAHLFNKINRNFKIEKQKRSVEVNFTWKFWVWIHILWTLWPKKFTALLPEERFWVMMNRLMWMKEAFSGFVKGREMNI